MHQLSTRLQAQGLVPQTNPQQRLFFGVSIHKRHESTCLGGSAWTRAQNRGIPRPRFPRFKALMMIHHTALITGLKNPSPQVVGKTIAVVQEQESVHGTLREK